MVKPKNFFKIYRQFGHAPTKRFAIPDVSGYLDDHVATDLCTNGSEREEN
jgi:hypothetical protein